jgi:hypothetical protein
LRAAGSLYTLLVMRVLGLAMVLLSPALLGQSPVDHKTVIARLSTEADSFERSAYRIMGREKLVQVVPDGVRVGRSLGGTMVRLPGYTREIVSEYGFVSIDAKGGSLREIRRVLTIDGQRWNKESSSLKTLARDMMAADDKTKLRSLERMEDFGLTGFVTDLGQLILLFARGGSARYEILYERVEADGTLVFAYQQIDGTEGVTVFGETDVPVRQRMRGRIWVQQHTMMPMRISFDSTREYEKETVIDRSTVEYAPSKFGTLLPAHIKHEQFLNGILLVTDNYDYTNWTQILPSINRSK